MSNIYIQEPPSNGKVLLTTSFGEIDIELWSKEAPKACRNFVQLCMEGYYDNTIFHRVEKDFVAQGGDPTGTGTGGESIYGKPFKDEFHQRLKFNRRGLVAMANAGKDDNGSQFFFTLGAAEELQKKHTIFGKVTGNTLYNMIRFNDIDVDEENRPIAPPKVVKTQVLSNPFDDIEPRRLKSATKEADKEKKKVKSKSKATKNYKLLSFGEEAEDDEVETDQATKELHIKSSHDLLNDPKLSSLPAIDDSGRVADECKLPVQKKKKKESESKKKEVCDDEDTDDSDEDSDAKRKNSKKKKLSSVEGKKEKKEKIEKEENKKSDKKEKDGGAAVSEFMVELLNERKEFRKQQKTDSLLKKGEKRQDETLALLASFQSKVSSIAAAEPSTEPSEQPSADDEDATSDSWMSHKLEFQHSQAAKDANMKGDDWYDIYDPRNPVNERKRKKPSKDGKQSVK